MPSTKWTGLQWVGNFHIPMSGCQAVSPPCGDPLPICWWTLYRVKANPTGYIFADCICAQFCLSRSIVLGVVTFAELTKVAKNSKKTRYVGARSFKVIEFGTNRTRIKSAIKFLYVKTSSGKVLEQSISYKITEKYRTENVSFYLKYLLSLPRCCINTHATTALPNDVTSKNRVPTTSQWTCQT